MKVAFKLNGVAKRFEVEPSLTLANLLRAQGLWSVRHGCEDGRCGSCAVIVDGAAVNSCCLLAPQVAGKSIETLESIEKAESLGTIKEALMDFGDIDCGFCIPGMIVSVKALVDKIPDPTEEELFEALSGNSCHCTKSVKPVRAILKALKGRGS